MTHLQHLQLEYLDFTEFYDLPMPKFFLWEEDDVSLLSGSNARWLDFADRLSVANNGYGMAQTIKVRTLPFFPTFGKRSLMCTPGLGAPPERFSGTEDRSDWQSTSTLSGRKESFQTIQMCALHCFPEGERQSEGGLKRC